MFKNTAAVLGLTALTLGLVACGPAEEPTPAPVITEISTVTSTSSESEPPASTVTITAPPNSDSNPEPVVSENASVVPTTSSHTEPAGPWAEPGTGWNCNGTDAWVTDPSYCTSRFLGGDPSYDEVYGPAAAISADSPAGQATGQKEKERLARVPVSEGGFCPDSRCG